MTKSERELLLAMAQVLRVGRPDIGQMADRMSESEDKEPEPKAHPSRHHK